MNAIINLTWLKPVTTTLCCMLLFLASGCSTIHFTQSVSANDTQLEVSPLVAGVSVDTAQTAPVVMSQWHDSTLDGMIEISPPVNLYKKCEGKPWRRVTSKLTFTNGLVAAVVSGFVTAVAPIMEYINLYTPWTVEVTCEQEIAVNN